MSCAREALLLYAVTDRAWTGERTLCEQVEAALKGGVTCVQLREKELDDGAFLQEAREIGALCRRYEVPFIVNDQVDIARACGADGIHVGQDDLDVRSARQLVGDKALIGVSAHTVEEAREAVAAGADYLGVGAMHATATKEDADIVSIETLRQICAAVEVPVVAIGGIDGSNMGELAGSGIDGVALVSAIFAAADIEARCRELLRAARDVVCHGA